MDGTTASSVNGLTFEASAASADVKINAQGSDTHISVDIVPKGSGTIKAGGSTLAGIESDQSILAQQVFS